MTDRGQWKRNRKCKKSIINKYFIQLFTKKNIVVWVCSVLLLVLLKHKVYTCSLQLHNFSPLLHTQSGRVTTLKDKNKSVPMFYTFCLPPTSIGNKAVLREGIKISKNKRMFSEIGQITNFLYCVLRSNCSGCLRISSGGWSRRLWTGCS